MQALPRVTHGKDLCKARHQSLMGRNYASPNLHSLILTVLFWKAEYAIDELPRTAIAVITGANLFVCPRGSFLGNVINADQHQTLTSLSAYSVRHAMDDMVRFPNLLLLFLHTSSD